LELLKNNWKKLIGILGAVFLFIFMLKFGMMRADPNDLLTNKEINHISSIEAYVVKKISLEDKISFLGDVEASDIEIVSSKISAQTETILVEDGDFVRAEQELVILDNEDYERAVKNAEIQLNKANLSLDLKKAEFITAEAAYHNALINLDRMKKLRDADAVPQKDYEDIELTTTQAEATLKAAKTAIKFAESDVKTAELALEQAVANLSRTKVKSRINGVIANCNVKVGQLVSPGITLMEVNKIDPIYVCIDIPQDNIKEIKLGQSVNVKFLSYPDKIFTGKVVDIDQVLDKKSRTFGTKISLPNKEKLLKLGMSCEVEINLGKTEILAVPQQAFFSRDEEKYVFIIENNKVKSQKVETGRLLNGIVEIKSGLSEGDKVSITNLGYLKDGDLVKISSIK